MTKETNYSDTIIVIPTYNEIENVSSMIHQLFDLYPTIHILIVDDNSPDQTYLKVEELKLKFENLHLIKRKYKDGLGAAYIRGFQYCLENNFQQIVQMDCDFSHDPKEVELLLNGLKTYDLCIGSRYINGLRVINWPIKRLFLSLLAGCYIKLITGLPFNDCSGGFKAMKAKVLIKIDLDKIISKGYIFQTEINYKAWIHQFKIVEIPIIFYERKLGYSKLQKHVVIEGIITLLKVRFSSK